VSVRDLVLATHNRGKLVELADRLGALPVRLHTMDSLRLPPAEESGDTFEANAKIKAEACSLRTPHLVIADDSGLEVDTLGGEPGVRSARFGGPRLNDDDRNRLLLERLAGTAWEDRAGRFVCVVSLARNGAEIVRFRGEVAGIIALEPRGTRGFGYDPLFYYPPAARTFGELTLDEKAAVSHRGQALAAAAAWLLRNED